MCGWMDGWVCVLRGVGDRYRYTLGVCNSATMAKVNKGDTIRLELDMDEGTMRVVVNDADQGVCFTGMQVRGKMGLGGRGVSYCRVGTRGLTCCPTKVHTPSPAPPFPSPPPVPFDARATRCGLPFSSTPLVASCGC